MSTATATTTRVSADYFTVTNAKGVTYHVRYARGWWEVQSSSGGMFVAFAKFPPARAWVLAR